MGGPRRLSGSVSDADLVTRTRDGDESAYAELWSRHVNAGLAVARAYTGSFDPDDLVAEAFAKILQAIQNGGGPTTAFRAYLVQTIRNVANTWAYKQREENLEDADALADLSSGDEDVLVTLDREFTAIAFKSLPRQWQEILWYTEIDRLKAQELAALLGMSSNAVSALTYRAREGLRQAWIQAHFSHAGDGPDHTWTIERLGAYARGRLGKRDLGKMEAHLSHCADCARIAVEAKGVESRLHAVILPLVAGVAGAAAYTAWLNTTATPAASAAEEQSDDEHRPNDARRRRRRRRRRRAIVIAAFVVIAGLTVTVAAIAERAMFGRAVSTSAPELSSRPAATRPEGAGGQTVPLGLPVATPSQTPTPHGTDRPSTSRPLTPTMASPIPARPVPRSTPAPRTTAKPVPAPVIHKVDVGNGVLRGFLFPVVSGTALPGAEVSVTNGAQPPVTVTAGSTGDWTTPQLTGLPTGASQVVATQTTLAGVTSAASVPARVVIGAPPAIAAAGADTRFTVTITGKPGAGFQVFADSDTGWGSDTLGATGAWTDAYQWFTTAGDHTLSARYGGAERWGPRSQVVVAISR